MRDIVAPQSVWHSPVPYLLGGLGSMIALLAFALIILACSFWRNPTTPSQEMIDNSRSDSRMDEKNEMMMNGLHCSEGDNCEKVIVIMAGEDMPTFIAKPTSISELLQYKK
ncbi:hypothetical protein SUGI_0895050 [Cryptomeria japonica]|nr:hypothetical protein SUGI_0895050 [Cryptomeria japonica]